jgi:hypothetical protein
MKYYPLGRSYAEKGIKAGELTYRYGKNIFWNLQLEI